MVIVVHAGRAKSPEDAQTVCTLIAHLYERKITPGFVRAECAILVDDPCQVLGLEYWGTKAAQAAFRALEDTQRTTAKIDSYLVCPAEHALYEVRP